MDCLLLFPLFPRHASLYHVFSLFVAVFIVVLAVCQGQLRVGDVCQSGRVRDMCHVAYPEGAKEGGALVAVTSVGSVHVWGVPVSLGGGGDNGGSTEAEVHELELPLRASLNLKVGMLVTETVAFFFRFIPCISS